MKILVVDDSRAIHTLLREMLADITVTVQDAFNGQEAINLMSRTDFAADLVLLDWEMPVLTGIEALPQLKQIKPDLPVLMMTSKNAMSDIAEAMERGAADYVMKPFTKDILLSKIEQLVKSEAA